MHLCNKSQLKNPTYSICLLSPANHCWTAKINVFPYKIHWFWSGKLFTVMGDTKYLLILWFFFEKTLFSGIVLLLTVVILATDLVVIFCKIFRFKKFIYFSFQLNRILTRSVSLEKHSKKRCYMHVYFPLPPPPSAAAATSNLQL